MTACPAMPISKLEFTTEFAPSASRAAAQNAGIRSFFIFSPHFFVMVQFRI